MFLCSNALAKNRRVYAARVTVEIGKAVHIHVQAIALGVLNRKAGEPLHLVVDPHIRTLPVPKVQGLSTSNSYEFLHGNKSQ